jgi:hypothetical protein
MDIVAALRQEEAKLQHRLSGIQRAIEALNGRANTGGAIREATVTKKWVMSAAARARISKASKARWARFRADKRKKKKNMDKK